MKKVFMNVLVALSFLTILPVIVGCTDFSYVADTAGGRITGGGHTSAEQFTALARSEQFRDLCKQRIAADGECTVFSEDGHVLFSTRESYEGFYGYGAFPGVFPGGPGMVYPGAQVIQSPFSNLEVADDMMRQQERAYPPNIRYTTLPAPDGVGVERVVVVEDSDGGDKKVDERLDKHERLIRENREAYEAFLKARYGK